MGTSVHLDLHPLTPNDIPDPESPEFADFLTAHFEVGEKLAESMERWDKHSLKVNSTVQIVGLKNASIRRELNVKEYWCGRHSKHTAETVDAQTRPHLSHHSASYNPMRLVRSVSRRFGSHHADEKTNETVNGSHPAGVQASTDVERQARVMTSPPRGLYERFRRGLLEYHSQNEREYIEACRETECIQVYQPHVAEVWRLTYVTPPPTNPRTFVVLLLSRELRSEPKGERCFMNISIPFNHPNCPEKKGSERNHVRGKYVSVERVREMAGGAEVEWRMATSSDAGGWQYPPLYDQFLFAQQHRRRRPELPEMDGEPVSRRRRGGHSSCPGSLVTWGSLITKAMPQCMFSPDYGIFIMD